MSSQTNQKQPSLHNAYERVARAKQHLMTLKRRIASFWRLNPKLAVSFGSATTGTKTLTDTPIPPLIEILVGEIVYNLRAALDYLIYELAILDSGQVQKRTQFPIVDKSSDWANNCRQYKVDKLTKRHKSEILALQPFSGCKWTQTLREISNPDKHRHLTIAAAGFHLGVSLTRGQTIKPPPNNAKKSQRSLALRILFDDGSAIIEELQGLQRHVADVLDSFNPDF